MDPRHRGEDDGVGAPLAAEWLLGAPSVASRQLPPTGEHPAYGSRPGCGSNRPRLGGHTLAEPDAMTRLALEFDALIGREA